MLDRQDKDNRRSRGGDESAQTPECASPSKKAKQAIGETKSETSISPSPDSATSRKTTPRLTPRILSEEFGANPPPVAMPPAPSTPQPFMPGFYALSPLPQVGSPLDSHTSLSQALENISIPAPIIPMEYVRMAEVNKAFVRRDRAAKGYTSLSYNDTLPGADHGALSRSAPQEFLSFGSTDELQAKAISQLSNVYARQLKNHFQLYTLYAKDDQLFLDPYLCTVMPDYRPVGSRVPSNFLNSKPLPAKDGMYAYVIVMAGDVYELRLFKTTNGLTNHSGMFGSSEERFAVGEIYIKNGKVVMMNDKTGSSHRDVLTNSAKLRLTGSSHKLAMEAFIPAQYRTPSALYYWNAENLEAIEQRITKEVLFAPLNLLLEFLKLNTNLFNNKNDEQRMALVPSIYARMMEGLIETVQNAKLGTSADSHIERMVLQLLNQLFQDFGLTLQGPFAMPNLKDPIKNAVAALLNVGKYHAHYNDICLQNKLVELGFTKTDKVQVRINEVPVELNFMPKLLEFEGLTPAASPLITLSHFSNSSTSSLSSSSSTSPLLPGVEQESPKL